MYNMDYKITIGKYAVNKLLSVEILKSANKLSDTATIELTGMAYNVTLEVESKIKRGDEVTIDLGYDGELVREFTGFVSSIKTDNTIEIQCEDSMFLTKVEIPSKIFKNVSAIDLIEYAVDAVGGFELVKGPGVDVVKYDKYTISNATAFEVFEDLKKDTDLHIFCKGKKLHVYLKFTYKSGDVIYDFSKNVESADLKYLKEEDKKVEIDVIGIDKENKKTTVTVGEKGGDKITVHRYNVSDKAALKVIGEEEIKKYRYTGYEGKLTGWLIPNCTYGYSATIRNPEYPEREGIYYVEGSKVSFSESGGVRDIEISILLV